MTHPHSRIYTIDLEPRGKGRPVFTRATGTARTPERTRAWEHEAAHQLRQQHEQDGLGVALDTRWTLLHVGIEAYYVRPKTRPWWMPAHIWKAAREGLPHLPACTRYDLDNVVKIVLDAMQIAKVIENDRAVVKLEASAFYAHPGEDAAVSVTVSPGVPG